MGTEISLVRWLCSAEQNDRLREGRVGGLWASQENIRVEGVQNDCRTKRPNKEDAGDRVVWRVGSR